MIKFKFITRNAPNGKSNLLMCDDGTISMFDYTVSSTGIEFPVYFYKCKESTDEIMRSDDTYLFAYITEYGTVEYVTSLKEVNGKFITSYVVLQTTDKSPELRYVSKYRNLDELKLDINTYNSLNNDIIEEIDHSIVEKYESACNDIVEMFCEKHEYDYDEDMWVGSKIGTICCISDMFIDFHDMYYDVKNNIPESLFEKWYWQSLEIYQTTRQTPINYETYCKTHNKLMNK